MTYSIVGCPSSRGLVQNMAIASMIACGALLLAWSSVLGRGPTMIGLGRGCTTGPGGSGGGGGGGHGWESGPRPLHGGAASHGLQVVSSPTYLVGRVKPMNHSHATCKQRWGRGPIPGAIHKICHFRSVCWDRADRTFVYFKDPDNLPLIIDTKGRGPIDTWADNSIQVKTFIPGAPLSLMPLVERPGPIPAAESTFAEPEVHVFFESHWAENFGHALGDDLMPAFLLQTLFGLLTPDSVLMMPKNVGHPACNPIEMWQRARQQLNKLAVLISDHPIVEMDVHPTYAVYDDKGHGGKDGKNTTAGNNNNNDDDDYGIKCDGSCQCSNKGGGIGWGRFSDYMIEQAMRRWPAVAAASRPLAKQRILIVEKMGRRRVLNVPAMADYLRAAFAVQVDVIRPDTLSLQDGIVEYLSSSVIITPQGGTSFGIAFARARSSVVIVTSWDPNYNAANGLDRYLWEHNHRLTEFYYDVEPSDITILPPGNASHPSNGDWQTFGSVTVNLARMGRVVASALTSAEHELDIPTPSFSKHMNSAFLP